MNSASSISPGAALVETPQSPGWHRLYEGWLQIAARFGEVQTLVLLTLIYAFVMGPFAIVIAILRKDMLDKRNLGGEKSAWSEADTAAPDLERAKRLF